MHHAAPFATPDKPTLATVRDHLCFSHGVLSFDGQLLPFIDIPALGECDDLDLPVYRCFVGAFPEHYGLVRYASLSCCTCGPPSFDLDKCDAVHACVPLGSSDLRTLFEVRRPAGLMDEGFNIVRFTLLPRVGRWFYGWAGTPILLRPTLLHRSGRRQSS